MVASASLQNAKSRRQRDSPRSLPSLSHVLLLTFFSSLRFPSVHARSVLDVQTPTDWTAAALGVESELELRSTAERGWEPWKRASDSPLGYFDPNSSGGSMLTSVPDTFPEGLGEPINAIITANSDSAVLVDSASNGGLQNYFESIGYAGECLGQHQGVDQSANLGDGNGYVNQTAEMRWDYGDPTLGTCTETIQGGGHFRYWRQDGSSADSGAYFLAVSYELPIAQQHDIIDNGYNLGRDWLVGNATAQSQLIPTTNLTNGTTYSGSTSAQGWTYQTSVQYVSGMLPNTSDGINHFQGFTTNACDGLVAVMTVSVTSKPQQATSNGLHAYAAPFRITSFSMSSLTSLVFAALVTLTLV